MKSRSLVFVSVLAGMTFCTNADAQQFYNNWNTAACGFTDVAGLQLRGPTRLTAITLWYHWGPDESEARYEIYQNGEFVKRGHLMRAGCDPYQEAWCEARANIGISLPRGYVEVRTEYAKICQNGQSNGEGFIQAFGMRD